MWLNIILCFCALTLKNVCCHKKNVILLEEIKQSIENVTESQTHIKLGIEALNEVLREQVKEINKQTEVERKEAAEDEEDTMADTKVQEFVERLNKLEKNIEAVRSYVESEKETDEFLRGLYGETGNDFNNDMLKVKELTAQMKDELKVLLEPVDNELSGVEEFANSRNVIIGGVLYYDGIGSACGSSFDVCRVQNSVCRDGKCQCLPGMSHDSLHEKCVETCEDGYGNTYQTVHNYIIREHNRAVINQTSLEDCKLRCETEDSFNCRSIDYFPRWDRCFLSDIVKGEAEDAWEYNSAGIHFQRDCIVDRN